MKFQLIVSVGILVVCAATSSFAQKDEVARECKAPKKFSLPVQASFKAEIATHQARLRNFLIDGREFRKCIAQYYEDNKSYLTAQEFEELKLKLDDHLQEALVFSKEWNSSYTEYVRADIEEKRGQASQID